MKKYIGTKIIKAQPMTRGDYNKFRGWELPADEDGSDPGYLKDDGRGHIQWDPENTFHRDFKPMTGMSFGLAIEAMKAGHKVARAGWNGKGMFVVYQKGYPDGIPCNKQTAEAFGINEGDLFKCRPYMQLKCVDGSCQMWQPSVSDCLEEDWMVM